MISSAPQDKQRVISVFDTTLRDGEQAPGNEMSPEDKLVMAQYLEALGVNVIEAGFPASSPQEVAAARLLRSGLKKATIATFCRAVRADVLTAVDAIGTERHQVQILATASELHLEHKRGISRGEAVGEIADSVSYAAELGVENISVALEDSSRGHPDLLRALIDASVVSGATTLVVCDTSGCLTPAEFGSLISDIREYAPDDVTLSTHCHNDMGLALANALAGIEAGADQVQTTLGGVGERSGNTALEEFAAVMRYKGGCLGARTLIDSKELFGAFTALRDIIDLETVRNKAIFGENAFATQAGMHQAGVLRKPETYEYLEPTEFGRERSIIISRHSGRAVIRHILEEENIGYDNALLNRLYATFIDGRESSGRETLDSLRLRISEWITRQLVA